MALFDKASQIVQSVGENVAGVGNALVTATIDQKELAGLKIQLDTVAKSLDVYYAQIGKRYAAYIKECRTEAFDVNDIFEQMQPALEQKANIEAKIAEKEQAIKNAEAERVKQKAKDEYDKRRSRLERALTMDIITVEEYQQKLEAARKKYDHFEILRKIDMQYKMQIITKEEYEEKKKAVLET